MANTKRVTPQQTTALQMRADGATWAEVAEVTGHNYPTCAYQAATRARRKMARNVEGRRFGVEVEFIHNGNSVRGIVAALRAAGLAAESESYNHTTRAHWKLTTDASVRNGLELVSPPLAGEDGIAQLRTAMSVLQDLGCSVNLSTGLHVHHDMDGLDGATIARFVELWAANAQAIDGLVAPSRRRGGSASQWCRPLFATEVDRAADAFRNGADSTALRGFDRYRSLNVTAFPKYGTIEIRQHQGTLNAEKVEGWIRLVHGLIGLAVASVKVAHDEPFALIDCLATVSTLDEDTAATLRRRAGELAR